MKISENENLVNDIEKIINRKKILINEPMKNHTSFKIGGLASFLILPEKIEEIESLIRYAKEGNLKHYIIGNGTNLLVSDEGFDGIIIKLSKNFSDISLSEQKIKIKSGVSLPNVVAFAYKNSLSGFEFALGIPGSIGGAVCMNAGAFGAEIKDVVVNVVFLEGDIINIFNSSKMCKFDYRSSYFKNNNTIILEATFKLQKNNKEEIKQRMIEIAKKRTENQPSEPSAGSIFKKPKPNIFVGKLIEEAGLKGTKIGNAQISEKHAGFIINNGNATANDVKKLIEYIKNIITQKFNLELELEIIII